MKIIILTLVLITRALFGQLSEEGRRINISDTSIKKNYYDMDSYNSRDNGTLKNIDVVVGWDYDGGGIYEILDNKRNYTKLLESSDKYFFCTEYLNYDDDGNDILLVGGYWSRCLCGLLMILDVDKGLWREINFDDLDNPFVSNINCIAKNKTNEYSFDKDFFSRLYLGCNNGTIFYSDDSAKTFQKAKLQAGNESITKIIFVSDSVGFALAGANRNYLNKVYFTIDTGSSWKLLKDFSEYNYIFNDILPIESYDINDYDIPPIFLLGSLAKTGVIVKYTRKNSIESITRLPHFSANMKTPAAFIGGYRNNNIGYTIDENGVLFFIRQDKWIDELFPSSNDTSRIGTFLGFEPSSQSELGKGCGYQGIVYTFNTGVTDISPHIPDQTDYAVYSNIKNTLIIDAKLKSTTLIKVEIYNIMGEKIYNFDKKTNKSLTLQLSEQPSGIYFYKILTKKNVFSGKFLIY